VSAAVLSSRSTSLLADGSSPEAALAGGMRTAFMVSAALSLVVVAMAVVLPGRLPAPQDDTWDHGLDDDLDDGIADPVAAV
jgi:DHA2 family lincomycin resistance protein-like MFS transporter